MKSINPADWTRADFIKFYNDVWGCPCIPVAATKKPTIKWAEYQEDMPTKANYRDWFKASWGIAIVMRNGLFSIDLDTEELFKELRSEGAFPRGACMYKSKRGYHVIMRANRFDRNYPYSVQEHSEDLTAINPLYYELGIGGVGHLAIVPDTPDRLWLPGDCFDQPVVVDYDKWLEDALSWSKGKAGADKEGDVKLWCPLHNDRDGGTPSLIINSKMNAAHCFGCGWKSNIWQLDKEIRRRGLEVPAEVAFALLELEPSPDDGDMTRKQWVTPIGIGRQPDLIERFLPGGENAKLLIMGPEKIGKTELANTIASNAASGIPVLGKLAIPRPLITAIGNFEQVGDDLTEQINDMAILYKPPPPDMLYKLDLEGRKLDNPKDEAYLKKVLAIEPKIELLILDSMYMSVTNWNDEIKARTVTRILGEIVKELGCAVILLTHSKAEGGGSLFGARQQEVVSMLGWHLKRWCGSYLIYSDMPEAQNRYYGKLEGIVRGGVGMVSYGVAYSSLTHAVSIVNWDDMPMQEGMEAHAVRRQDRVRAIQQLTIAAQQLGYNQSDLARAIGVDRGTFTYWVKGEKTPGDDNWDKVEKVIEALVSSGKLDGAAPTAVKRNKRVTKEIDRAQADEDKSVNTVNKIQAKAPKAKGQTASKTEGGPPPSQQAPGYNFNNI